jgi:uncharacterized repeat protein (TIGR02543 family)
MPEIVVRVKAYQANGSLDWNQPVQIAHWNDGGYHTAGYNLPNMIDSIYLTYKWRFDYWQESGNWDGGKYPSGDSGSNGISLYSRANPPVLLVSLADNQEWSGWGSSVLLWTTDHKKWTFWFDLIVTGTLYTIYYNGNTNTGGYTNNTSLNWSAYATLTIAYNGFTKTGYSFIGWGTQANGNVSYQGGNSIAHPGTGSLSLYALWTIIRHTVTFNSTTNGITTNRYVTVNYGSSVSFPTFKAVGYTFLRWVNAYNTTYDSISSLTGDITLYAVWQEKNNINFTELNRVYNGTRGSDPINRGANSISIGKFRAESGQTGTNQIKLITHFKGKG